MQVSSVSCGANFLTLQELGCDLTDRLEADGARRPTATCRGGRGRCRGVRAGRHVQRRRHGDDRDSRRLRDAQCTPVARCLIRPARLAERRTARLSRDGTDGDRGTAASGSRGMPNIGHLNVRSLTNKLYEVIMLLRNHELDIHCLSDTFLTAQVLDKFLSFPGYNLIMRDREGRLGGGVAIIHRTEITAKPLAMPNSNPLETLGVCDLGGGRHITVGVIYRPPSCPVSTSLDALQRLPTAASSAGRLTFLLGDVNFDVLDGESPNTKRYTSVIEEMNMQQLVNSPIHLQPRPSTLDHVITDLRDPSPVVRVLPDIISDHQPVVTTARLGRVRRPAQWRLVQCGAGGGSTGTPSVSTCCDSTGHCWRAPPTSTLLLITS